MKKVLIDEKVKALINTKFKSDKKQIISYFKKLELNSQLGDFVFAISNVECREIKIKGIRMFTVQYRNQIFISIDDTFYDTIKIINIARKNKSMEQQRIIDNIKKRIKSFGMDI
ncbi:MAG: hypothetical protein LAT82_00620 [Nanoarchaeota archaeon]|nr:hypothetical protein [Nanoarchaeota archaeon]